MAAAGSCGGEASFYSQSYLVVDLIACAGYIGNLSVGGCSNFLVGFCSTRTGIFSSQMQAGAGIDREVYGRGDLKRIGRIERGHSECAGAIEGVGGLE